MPFVLEVTGDVEEPRFYDFDALSALDDQIEDVSTVSPGRSGGAVTLSTILQAAKPSPSARFITIEAEEGYSASVPLAAVADQAIIMYRQGDDLISVEQGGPLRFLIPDVAACRTAEVDACANVKRLSRIVLSVSAGRDTRPKSREKHRERHEQEAESRR